MRDQESCATRRGALNYLGSPTAVVLTPAYGAGSPWCVSLVLEFRGLAQRRSAPAGASGFLAASDAATIAGMHTRALACLYAALLASACQTAQVHPPTPSGPQASVGHVLIVGGTLRVSAPDWRLAQALYAENGRVVAIGDEPSVRSRAREPYTTIDLEGAVAVPGLIDAHAHLEGLGSALDEVDLRACADYPELIARVAAHAAQVPAGTWIQGRGWDQNLWPDRQFPHHAQLSRAVPDHPVVLGRVDGHAILVNARALELAGQAGIVGEEHPMPGGRILIDADRRPTGVFVDNATALIEKAVPPADLDTRRRRVLLAQEELVRHGLTGVHDMGESQESMRLLAAMSLAGELRIEVAGYMSQAALGTLDTKNPLVPVAGPWTQLGYRLVGAKLYMDGALGSRGAALLEDYADEAGNRGLPMLEPAQLDQLLELCDANGMQPAVHAIGDLGNRRVLDAYERRLSVSPGFAVLRPRIEHAQVVAARDWERFGRLGVVPSMQPTHATSDMPWAPARLGKERIEGAYAWRRLDPEGLTLALGSDCPVESCDPLAGLYAAITCADARGEPREGYRPDQRIEPARALAGFTTNAARAARQEHEFGRLEPGFWANLTVLDVDPLSCAPRELLGGDHVRRTIIRGQVVYEASAPR